MSHTESYGGSLATLERKRKLVARIKYAADGKRRSIQHEYIHQILPPRSRHNAKRTTKSIISEPCVEQVRSLFQ